MPHLTEASRPASNRPVASSSRSALAPGLTTTADPAGPCEPPPAPSPARSPLTWDNLPQRYGRDLRIWARGRLRLRRLKPTRDRVEEIVQDTYCRLFRVDGHSLSYLNRLNEAQRREYLRKAVVSATVDRVRRELALKRGVHVTERLGVSAEQEIGDYRRPESTPETQAEARMTLAHLLAHLAGEHGLRRDGTSWSGAGAWKHRARARLARNLTIFYLAVACGWTSREIADSALVPLSASAVDSVVHRMRRRLRGSCCEMATLGAARLSAASPPRTPRACAPWDRTS